MVTKDHDEQGTETGYVTDSSLNSRKGMIRCDDEKQNIKRKTKSERDKRRSSRASVIEVDSGSETSSSLEQTQNRYRKRAGSKKGEYEIYNIDEKQRFRKRAGSKTSSPQTQRVQSYVENLKEEKIDENLKVSTMTIKMDSKDIYFGTWNPKERAVLDQVLNNIDLTVDKKSEEIKSDDSRSITSQSSNKSKQHEKKKSLFCRIKKVLKIHDRQGEEINTFPIIEEDPLQDYVLPPKRKKSLFKRLVTSKKKNVDVPRRRAHSTNDSAHYAIREQVKSNLNKKRSGSTHSLKSLFNRAKSVDNLNGAFDYFANQNQVFQRTPSMSKLQCKSRTNSVENLNNEKRSLSQKSLSHCFEPVAETVKEICYNDESKMFFAESKIVQHRTASQRSVFLPPTRQSSFDQQFPPKYYDSALEVRSPSSRCTNGYHSDVTPASATPTMICPKNKETPYQSYSAMTTCPSSCPPTRKAFRPPPYEFTHHSQLFGSMKNDVNTTLTDGGTVSNLTSGTNTPLNSGYNSETDCGNIPTEQLSMVPYHARRAIQRSLSKKSSASYSSNYGYLSESSFCEDDEYYGGKIENDVFREKLYLRNDFSRLSCKSTRSTLSTDL